MIKNAKVSSIFTKRALASKKLISIMIIIILLFTYVVPFSKVWAEEGIEENVEICQEIQKYIPYSYSDDEQGVILQEKVKINSKIEETKQIDINITIPEYCNIMPENIEIRTKNDVITDDTKLDKFYIMNSENTEIKITEKSDFDYEYYITYYYPKEAYDKYLDTTHVKEYPDGELVDIKQDEETGDVYAYIDFAWDEEENTGEKPDSKVLMDKILIVLKTSVEIKTEKEIINKEQTTEKEVILQISSPIDSECTINITEISKGELYAKKEINYDITNSINIIRSDILKQLTIENLRTKFVLEDGSIKNINEKCNSLTINKNNLTKILGEEGYISLLDENSEEITRINSESETDENGNIVFEYSTEKQKINIELIGIKNNGFLEIKQNKTILSNQDITKEEIMNSKQITTTVKLNKIEGFTQEIEKNVEISLKESYSKAKLNINNNNLSTVDTNTGVEFKIELLNNNSDSDLWENPVIVIELPKEIEEISINSANMLYGDNLNLHSYTTSTLNGNKTIMLQLIGKQQDFISSSIEGGTTIIVNTNIKLKELTLTSSNNLINLYYFNGNKTNYEKSTKIELNGQEYEVGISDNVFNYVAPVGFTTLQQISNFDNEGTIINSVNSEKEVGKIKILEPEKEANYKIILMNNTGNKTTRNKSNWKCAIYRK